MRHLELTRKKNLSPFRRMALGTWRNAYDPTVYGSLVLPMDEALRYLADFREKTGRRLTVSHMMAKAVGQILQEMPDANAILRWNRIYLRDRITVFFQVETSDPETGEIDLSGATVHDPEKKSLLELVDDFEKLVRAARAHADREVEQGRSLLQRVPNLLLNSFLRGLSFSLYTLNLDPKLLGAPRDAFGSVMITNVGSLGLEEAYVPLVPFSRVPLLLALGKVEEAPYAEGGVVRTRKQMRVFATMDHRVLDGAHAAAMSRTLRAWFDDPYGHFGQP